MTDYHWAAVGLLCHLMIRGDTTAQI